jgi:hypothetical protein
MNKMKTGYSIRKVTDEEKPQESRSKRVIIEIIKACLTSLK